MERRGRELCAERDVAERREWLVANGRGGYALGTVAGPRTRAYHGLLIAALAPPVARRLVVTGIEVDVVAAGTSFALGTNRWASGALAPEGWRTLDAFAAGGGVVEWTHVLGAAVVTCAFALAYGSDALAYTVTVERAAAPLEVRLRLLVHDRDHHGGVLPDGFATTLVDGGAEIVLPACQRTLHVRAPGAVCEARGEAYRGYALAREAERGLPSIDDAWHALDVRFTLGAGASGGLVAALEPPDDPAPDALVERRRAHDRALIAPGANGLMARLTQAADAFVVARGDGGRTIVAGYPWFEDWGRDTMIALPGLLLATGRHDDARDILTTFGRFVDGGMLPNRFPDAGGAPEYNTVDAALWYVEAVRAYVAATGDDDALARWWPALRAIVEGYRGGTRYGIKVEPDGLVRAGIPGVQLTWMDAKVGADVITPRIGKPVEINALWYAALRAMEWLGKRLDRPTAPYRALGDAAAAAFDRFWNVTEGYCYDVIDGPDGNDARIRPNAVFAAALHVTPLRAERVRAVVDRCARELWTPMGLRTLAPDDPAYAPRYAGDVRARDRAYHNGTVWPWLLGPFVRAHVRAYGDPVAARAYLAGAIDGLDRLALGTLAEVADGAAPHDPAGAPAQAWSVAALLETLALFDAPAATGIRTPVEEHR